MHDLNQQEHSFDATAKIKEESDKVDKYLLWKVVDGRFAEDGLTAIFRTSKEKLEILLQMQQGLDGAIAKEYCFLDAEHDLCSGMKTINLTILHPTLREVTTVASMDCNEESTASLCRFWDLYLMRYVYCKFMTHLVNVSPFMCCYNHYDVRAFRSILLRLRLCHNK